MGVYREGPKMRSLLEGSRKARESCRAILTFDRQKGGPKMSQNVSYFDILGFQKVGHKMWSTRSTRLLRVWGTPKCHFWDPCWHTLDKTGIRWTGKVGIFGYIVQKGVKKGSKRGSKTGHFRVRFWTPICKKTLIKLGHILWITGWAVPAGLVKVGRGRIKSLKDGRITVESARNPFLPLFYGTGFWQVPSLT